MTWDQDNSDVDLHVKEPTINGTDGRHYLSTATRGHRTTNNPYLDLDNTYGFGPEHYYATENMTLPQTGNRRAEPAAVWDLPDQGPLLRRPRFQH